MAAHIMTGVPDSIPAPSATAAHTRWTSIRLLLIAVAVIVFALPCIPFIGIAIHVSNAYRERQRLLHETDHHALLAACREVIRDYAGQHIADPSNDPRVPVIIRGLRPSYMDISVERLRVELHGGFDHYGFVAYPEGENAGDESGKLIDGLYYYTE